MHDRRYFGVKTGAGYKVEYLDAAAVLRPQLAQFNGFVSIEQFESLSDPGKILSLSFWHDDKAVRNWRNLDAHRTIRQRGATIFLAITANVPRRLCATTACATACVCSIMVGKGTDFNSCGISTCVRRRAPMRICRMSR